MNLSDLLTLATVTMAMSWQATLSAVFMLSLELRTEMKEMKQWASFVCFGSCFWKLFSVIGIKCGCTPAAENLRLISTTKKMMLLEHVRLN